MSVAPWLTMYYHPEEDQHLYAVKAGGSISWNDGDACNAAVTEFLLQNGPPNPVCVDIGADEGWWTSFCLEQCPSATVVAFEPNPNATPLLQSKFGADSRVILRAQAVSDTDAGVPFCSDGAQSNSRCDPSNTVPSTRPDFLFENHEFIHCIKMDTEGHELRILSALAPYYPRIGSMIFEFTPYWYGESKEECMQASFSALSALFEEFPYMYSLSRRGLPTLTQIEDEESAFALVHRHTVDGIQTDIVCSRVPISISVLKGLNDGTAAGRG